MFDPQEISLLVRSYYDIQKVRIEHLLRVKTIERQEDADEKDVERHYRLGVGELEAAEKILAKRIDQETRDHPVRADFMSKVSGIGPILSGGVIAHIARRKQNAAIGENGQKFWVTSPDLFPNEGVQKERYKELGVKDLLEEVRDGIACFENISCLWSFSGLAVIDGTAVRRKKGEKANWSSTMKVLSWKIGESFVKCGKSYRREFDDYKAKQQLAHPEKIKVKGSNGRSKTLFNPGHLNNRAKRYVAKLFLAHTWLYWREHEGLETRGPWIIGRNGHKTLKPWHEYLDK